jgi:hypothetical protein
MLEPEAVAVHLEDVDVMGKAIEQRAGQLFTHSVMNKSESRLNMEIVGSRALTRAGPC